ncbi:MAG: hypothetical protein WCL27_15640 [Betaproteobacteria bacterium]
MQAFKYTLRLLFCRPLLIIFGGIFFLCVALTLLASFILPSLTWQAALLLGPKVGAMFAGALWAMFFLKTYTAVLASERAALLEDSDEGSVAAVEGDTPAPTEVNKSGLNKPD